MVEVFGGVRKGKETSIVKNCGAPVLAYFFHDLAESLAAMNGTELKIRFCRIVSAVDVFRVLLSIFSSKRITTALVIDQRVAILASFDGLGDEI